MLSGFRIALLSAAMFSLVVAATPSQKVQTSLKQMKTEGKSKGWTFDVGYSSAMDIPLGNLTGFKLPANWRAKATFVLPRPERGLPSHFDWREEAGGLTPIKNQGRCGSCWAFGTAAVLESLIKIRDNVSKSISEQDLVSCNRKGYTCGGGYFVLDMFKSLGAAYTEDVPYSARDLRCKTTVPRHEKIEHWGYVGKNNRNPSVDEMKAALYQYGPLGVTVAATGRFQAYKSGIYNACDGRQTNHIVSIIGWDDDEKTWILRNSWGANWGEKGYMRIRWNCNKLGEMTTFADYKPTCTPQPEGNAGDDRTIAKGQSTMLGAMAVVDQTYLWSPSEGLDDPTSAMPVATPTQTTTYKLHVSTSCGSAEKSVTVTVTDNAD